MNYCAVQDKIKTGCPIVFEPMKEPCVKCPANKILNTDLPEGFDILFPELKTSPQPSPKKGEGVQGRK